MAEGAYFISHDWEDPDGLHSLLQAVRDQRPDANYRAIRYAYYLAEKAHAGQTRQSGEPYIQHPLEVARILVGLGMDDETIIAGLLHDVVEDTSIAPEEIEAKFGPEIRNMVEGVTKLSFKPQEGMTAKQKAAAETTRAAESLRKMLLAMARDLRVMVIKLADRLHNMKTLDALAPHKRARISNETLDIYAPLAARLGMWQIKWELEDLAFSHLHPHEFEEVRKKVAATNEERSKLISQAILIIKEKLESYGLHGAEIKGRPKHLYSIFNKMVKQKVEFEDIYDLLALRIVMPGDDPVLCYTVQGIISGLWPVLPELGFDYIAKPKPNGYQSIHMKVIGPGDKPLEIQIRTRRMHEIAERGVAAHWTYKEGGGKSKEEETKRYATLREQLFDFSSDSRLSSDFLRSVSTDLFAEQVFVFTPHGDVLDLPVNSTPVDAAFRIHSQLGLNMVGAKVNGTMVPLNTKLRNGDIVDVVTRNNATPSLDWLEFVASANAKSKIKSYFRKHNKEDDARRGKDLIERELKLVKCDPKEFLTEDKLKPLLREFAGLDDASDLFARVGAGIISATNIVGKLRGTNAEKPNADTLQITGSKEGKLVLDGVLNDILVSRSKCCLPIPGDDIVGYVTRGRGIYLHRKVCPNAIHFASKEPERLLQYEWRPDRASYGVPIKIICFNRQGLLADVSNIFGEAKANVSAMNIKTLANKTAEINVTIDVTDTGHLQGIFDKISNFSDVISTMRLYGKTAKE